MNQDPEDWHRAWTRTIGGQVRKVRTLRGMSAQALSDRCTEIGYPIPRNTITNLENGRKTTLTLGELAIMAAALDTSPVQLLYPLAGVQETEALPGRVVTPIEAVQWFAALSDALGWTVAPVVRQKSDDDIALEVGRKYLEVKRERDSRARSFNIFERRKASPQELEQHETRMRPLYIELSSALEQLHELGTGIPGYDRLIEEREEEIQHMDSVADPQGEQETSDDD